jgi:P-type conjugative transfer protein TrbJ
MKTRAIVASHAIVLVASLGVVPPTAAITVFDPSNYLQNTLTAVRTLEMTQNQIRQLQNEAQMLRNQARNLASLPFDVVDRLRANLSTTSRLISEAQGLAYELKRLDQDFARLYPRQYAGATSGHQMDQDAQERWRNTLGGVHTAMRMQAQLSQNLVWDERAVADLVRRSQSASGALQATQATNQLLALQAKQSIQAQQLQLTQDRAVALELARQASAAERGREVTRRFLGGGTPYTPHPVTFFRQ